MPNPPPELDSLTTQPCGCQVYADAGANGTEYRIRYCRLHGASEALLKAVDVAQTAMRMHRPSDVVVACERALPPVESAMAKAVKHYFTPLDNAAGIDTCRLCGHDIRDEIHLRADG